MTDMPAQADRSTASPGMPSATVRRGRHVAWIVPTLVSLACAGGVLWSASFPGVPFVGVVLVGLLGIVALLSWFVSLAWPAGLRRVVALVVSAVLLLGSIGVSVAGLPLRVRFALSMTAFDAVVADADAHPGTLTRSGSVAAGDRNPKTFPIRCPANVGRFRLSACTVTGRGKPSSLHPGSRGYLFSQNWNAVSDESVIAYLPDGPIEWAWEKPHHLVGPWYSATCGC